MSRIEQAGLIRKGCLLNRSTPIHSTVVASVRPGNPKTSVREMDKNVDRNGTRKVAEAFNRSLRIPTAQKVFADNDFRSATAEGKAYARDRFPAVKTTTIEALGG